MSDLKGAEYSPVPGHVGNAVGVGVASGVRVPQMATVPARRGPPADQVGRGGCGAVMGSLERIQRQMGSRRQRAGFQMTCRGCQAQRFAGFAGQALGFFQQAAADTALAGDFAYA